ncbi:MAG: hypothetical protein GY712_08665, partial [Oceanicoccus sp.]|uniref:hypothetical protein n=1 Tax=Oceanicoccus sp. TaxID=2691044 RepID=UPI002601C642
FPTSGLIFSGAQKTFTGSDFTLQTTASRTFTVTDGGVSQATSAISVTPAALASFTISGEPASVVAGVAFSTPANDIVVTAFDAFGNQKTNYTGTVAWSSSDVSASFPTSGLIFSGAQKTFTGSDFTLQTTTSQTFTVTDGLVNQPTVAITVTAAAIANFTLTNPAAQEAGVLFSLGVTGAVDAFGNAASGAVTVSFQDAGTHRVPNGESPTLTDITVTDGTGSANQTLD